MEVVDLRKARFHFEDTSAGDYAVMVRLPISGVQIPVQGKAVLSEFDYHAIDLVELELGKSVMFTLKPTAARAFYQLTAGNQGKRLVLVIDGQPFGARRIDGPIADGRIVIFLETSDEELERIVEQLRETNIEIQKKLSR